MVEPRLASLDVTLTGLEERVTKMEERADVINEVGRRGSLVKLGRVKKCQLSVIALMCFPDEAAPAVAGDPGHLLGSQYGEHERVGKN